MRLVSGRFVSLWVDWGVALLVGWLVGGPVSCLVGWLIFKDFKNIIFLV